MDQFWRHFRFDNLVCLITAFFCRMKIVWEVYYMDWKNHRSVSPWVTASSCRLYDTTYRKAITLYNGHECTFVSIFQSNTCIIQLTSKLYDSSNIMDSDWGATEEHSTVLTVTIYDCQDWDMLEVGRPDATRQWCVPEIKLRCGIRPVWQTTFFHFVRHQVLY